MNNLRDLLLRNVDDSTARQREDLLGEETGSDFWLLMRVWSEAERHDFRPEVCHRFGIHPAGARQVGPLLQQFLDIARREGLDTAKQDTPAGALQKCILVGFNDRVARRLDSSSLRCELVHGRRGTLARESVVRNASLLAGAEVREVECREKSVNTLLSLATAVDEQWLRDLFPEDIATTPHVFFDPETRRVQELYDVSITPKIAMGRVTVLVEILAPSMRPVQVTQDLASFWREPYPRVKQELQRKYPKHKWR